MIPKDILNRVTLIEISTRKPVAELLTGEYRSTFKGRGTEFEEVREYAPGDDFRSIDWNVTARRGHHYVKRFTEQRQRSIYFLVDFSASGDFGSVGKTKHELATELCALLAFAAIRNQDKVGLLLFSEEVERIIPPGQGATHVLYLITEMLRFRPRGRKTCIAKALETFACITPRPSVVFLLSDFQDTNFDRPLRRVAYHHDLIAITIEDPLERVFPWGGLVEFRDNETGEQRIVDTSTPYAIDGYAAAVATRRHRLQELFQRAEVDCIEASTSGDSARSLVQFFEKRQLRQPHDLAR